MATARETFYATLYEVAKGSVGRAREGAEFIEKAAAGIATVYGVILGIAFSVGENPLPVRGVLAPAFLGLAVVCAAYYLAYPSRPPAINRNIPANAGPGPHFNAFADWMSNLTLYRRPFLSTALLALFFGLLFIPAPFLAVKTSPPIPPSLAPFPDPPTSSIELQKIRYMAEINEVARLRREAAPQPTGQFKISESWIWWAAVAALAVLVLNALVTLAVDLWRRFSARDGDGGGIRSTPIHAVPTITLSED